MTSDPHTFGFRTMDDSADRRLVGSVPVPDDVWAIGPLRSPARSADLTVRVGFAGDRAHAGHIGLARSAANLGKRGGTLLIYDFGRRGDSTLYDDFRRCLSFFLGPVMATIYQVDVAAARDSALELLGRAKLTSVLRTYGWDDEVTVSRFADVLDMIGFLSFPLRGDADFAFADENQLTHLSVLRRLGSAERDAASTMMLRRLIPHLTRAGSRATSRDASSVLFLADDPPAVVRKVMKARTAGGSTEEDHKARGGSPSRCPVYLQFSAICGYDESAGTRAACTSGTISCRLCKCNVAALVAEHLDRIRAHRPGSSAAVSQKEGHRDADSRDVDSRA